MFLCIFLILIFLLLTFFLLQELGGSNSSYSLADQLRLNPLFSAEAGREISHLDVENLIAKMRSEWKVISHFHFYFSVIFFFFQIIYYRFYPYVILY